MCGVWMVYVCVWCVWCECGVYGECYVYGEWCADYRCGMWVVSVVVCVEYVHVMYVCGGCVMCVVCMVSVCVCMCVPASVKGQVSVLTHRDLLAPRVPYPTEAPGPFSVPKRALSCSGVGVHSVPEAPLQSHPIWQEPSPPWDCQGPRHVYSL